MWRFIDPVGKRFGGNCALSMIVPKMALQLFIGRGGQLRGNGGSRREKGRMEDPAGEREKLRGSREWLALDKEKVKNSTRKIRVEGTRG